MIKKNKKLSIINIRGKEVLLTILLIILFIDVGLASAAIIERGLNWNKINNSDGTFTLEFSELTNFDNGTDFEPINITISNLSCDAEYNFCVNKGVYEAHFKTDSNNSENSSIIKYTSNNISITYQPFKLQYVQNDGTQKDKISDPLRVNGTSQNNKFTYTDIFGPGFNLSFIYLPKRLKEELVITNLSILPAPNANLGDNVSLSLEFKIRADNINVSNHASNVHWNKVDDFEVNGRVDFKDSNNNTIFFLPKAYAYDSNASSNLSRTNVIYEFKKAGNNLFINLKTSYTWLNATERVYPVTIDPTIELSSEASSAASKNGNADTNFGTDTFISVGRDPPDLGEIRSFLQFNISDLPGLTPPGSITIDSALMNLFLFEDNSESSSRVINVHRVTNEWTENEITWNSRQTGVAWTTEGGDYESNISANLTIPASPTDGWFTWNLTNLTKVWYNETFDNYGVVLVQDDSNNWQHKFYSDDFSNSSLRPKLVVNYTCIDCDAPNLTLTEPNGTKTSRTDISINWEVADPNLETCLYNIYKGTTEEISNTTVTCSTNSTTFTVSSDGDFTLNFYANDSVRNINSTSSTFTVTTPSPPASSGSGGGSSNRRSITVTVIPPTLKFDIISDILVEPGDTRKIIWNVKNAGSSFLNNCKLKSSGNYSSWINIDENKNFAAGEEHDFIIDIKIPNNIISEIYELGLNMSCNEISKSINFNIEIIEKKLDFKFINVERNEEDKVKIIYTIKELSGIDQNIELQFLFLDNNNDIIAELIENKFLPSNTEGNFESYIIVDPQVEGGIKLLVNINSETYSTFLQEDIILGSYISGLAIIGNLQGNDTIGIGLILLFLILAFFIIRRIIKSKIKSRKKSKRKSKKHSK